MKALSFTIIAGMILVSCNKTKIDQQAEAEKLMNLSREWCKTAATDSLDKLLNYWADDAICLFPNEGAIKGKEAIKEYLIKDAIPGSEISWEPKEVHVASNGEMAYVIAQNYIIKPDSSGKKITTFNKSIEIWKKQKNGTWKCVVDMYNSDPTIKSIR